MNIDKIVSAIEKGNLVITPTDTVYGIMGDATNEETIKKIYKIKKRPYNKPLIILVDSYDMIKEYTEFIKKEEKLLIKEFMPGLVTIILNKNKKISNLITANSNYIGIRIPDNQELIKVIKKLKRPLVSTSANLTNQDVITKIEQLDEELKSNIDYIEDDGEKTNLSSTIVKFENKNLKIIRSGSICNILKERFKSKEE